MSTTPAGFGPYVLFRRGALDLSALSGLVPQQAWVLVDEAGELTAARDVLRTRIEDDLYALIPQLAVEQRRELLRTRRAVHNNQLPELSSATAAQLTVQLRAHLREWARTHQAADALLADAAAALAGELETARKTLAEVTLGENFRRGVQLGGEAVYREITAYAAAPFDCDRKPSRRRRTESTITSFAYRMVLKPSPFGSFTEIGAQPWSTTPVPSGPSARVAVARINIGLLAWMAHRLHGVHHSERLLRVRLNNSLVVQGDRVTWVRRPIEGADEALIEDQIVTARHTALVRLMTTALGDGDLSEHQLRARLVQAGLSAQVAASTIDRLVKAGLCHRGIGVPDQAARFAGHVAERLRALDTPQAAECARLFERTQAIEDQFATATTQRRTELLTELRSLIHRLARVCDAPAPEPEALESIVYEDVGTRAPATTWRPELLAANRDHLALWQRLVPVLDDATLERLGLYGFFVDRFGVRDVGLMEFFTEFAALAPTTAAGIMSGTTDPSCEHVRLLRQQFFDLLRDELTGDPDATELVLASHQVHEFVASVPAFVPPWPTATYRVQFAEDDRRRLAVLNGVTTGHGVFFARFCDLLEPDDPDTWSLRRELRAHIASSHRRQTDLTATLGLNFNLHPPLAPFELIYPGSVPRPGVPAVLTLPELLVRPDPETRRLSLVSRVDDLPINLVPLNLLFPAAAPTLYRFLCVFAPPRTYRGGLWEQLNEAGAHAGTSVGSHRYRPRLLLGDLVLDRRSWRFDTAELPDLDGAERHELGTLVLLDRWARTKRLPQQTFFRILPHREPGPRQSDPIEQRRQWALQARSARLHKPHYLDLRNPFLVSIFAKQVRSTGDASVIFQECLPTPDSYLEPGGPGSAEEIFFEFDLMGGDNADD